MDLFRKSLRTQKILTRKFFRQVPTESLRTQDSENVYESEAKQTTSRTRFLYISDKKELFIFIFQIKSISKGTFCKKGTKWQSLVNSRRL